LKIHVVDVLITRGNELETELPLGKFHIAKNRRGEVGGIYYSIRLNNGRFKTMPRAVYDDLRRLTEKREFTEAEIDAMIESYEKNKASIERQLSSMQQGPQQQQFKGSRPF